jgi:hypothetical protein
MATNHSEPASSPLVKAALAVLGLTLLGCAWLVFQQLAPKSHEVSEPPPLTAFEPPPAPVEAAPSPPSHTPEPEKVIPKPLAETPETPAIDIAKIPPEQLGTTLLSEKNPDRKLELIRRMANTGLPSVPYAVAAMFPDPDKRVRLEALRVVEATDKENRILTPKIHAVYVYEEDPEVKAVFNRILEKWRPQEEAEYKARQAQEALDNASK